MRKFVEFLMKKSLRDSTAGGKRTYSEAIWPRGVNNEALSLFCFCSNNREMVASCEGASALGTSGRDENGRRGTGVSAPAMMQEGSRCIMIDVRKKLINGVYKGRVGEVCVT